MAYESAFETFEATGPDGQAKKYSFKKAGFLAAGDQPELYFFEGSARPIVICVSGEALMAWQRAHRYLSREEKIDVAGLFLKKRIELSGELTAENLRVDGSALEFLLQSLGIPK
ncbi:MAG: hypothetical protein WAK91_08255 [Candidatus Acidiferrales bacterium]|jgi:hypothetical protein